MSPTEDLSTEQMLRYISNLEQRIEALRKAWRDADTSIPPRRYWKVQLNEHWPELANAIKGLL